MNQRARVIRMICVVTGFAAAISLIAAGTVSLRADAARDAAQGEQSEPVPAFHAQAPQGALPNTMSPATFDSAEVQNAYAVAARVRRVLYQQPCYCHCDRSQGHASLLDCFTNKHASGCEICMREAFYTYEQSRKGKTAAQIRAGIEAGEWMHVNVSKYQNPIPVK